MDEWIWMHDWFWAGILQSESSKWIDFKWQNSCIRLQTFGYGNLTFVWWCLTFSQPLSLSYSFVLSLSLSITLFAVFVSSVYLFKLQIIEIGINYPPIVNRNKSIPTLCLAHDINGEREREGERKLTNKLNNVIVLFCICDNMYLRIDQSWYALLFHTSL